MSYIAKKTKKRSHTLIVLFTTGVVLSVIGYILRGTVNAPAERNAEGAGVIIGLLSGVVFFVWFCLAVVNIFRKNLKNNQS